MTNYKMLVTTFAGDMIQFHMFCYCLEKNWQGKRDLIVCLGAGDNEADFQSIINEVFDSSWTVNVKSSLQFYEKGTTEQQVNAVYYSITSEVEDVIVWDCKDFLLRPCDFATFKTGNKYRHTLVCPDKRITEMGYDVTGLVDTPVDHIPSIINLRPWIWNIQKLKEYWTLLNSKFGNYSNWDEYPAGNEIYGYYIYTLTDPNNPIEYLPSDDTPLLLGGGWTHQTYEGILREVEDFDQWKERIVWKHSRKLEDPRCLEVTKSVLLKYGIEQEIIDRVFCYEEPGKP